MSSKRLSFTARYVLLFGTLLLAANLAMGVMILNQSRTAMRELINKNMLDVVKSAAASLDGDVLASLTEDDVDGPEFLEIENRLLVFQKSTDIHFIYAVKQIGASTYVFTVDPDPVDPGEFGEEVLVTPALVAAGKGVPTVDDNPAEDEWGNFYSAYCPVYGSDGAIAGIVGVDFDAEWYDQQMAKYTLETTLIASGSLVVGSVAVALMTSRVRKRFAELNEGLFDLSDNVDLLMGEITEYGGFESPVSSHVEQSVDYEADELEVLGNKIHAMQTEMVAHLDFLRKQAYIDSLTQVESVTAYHEVIGMLEEEMTRNIADFWVVVFDVNSLKELNDTFGHEIGDKYIQAAARAIRAGFPNARTFRIGGDEFVVIAEKHNEKDVVDALKRVTEAVHAFNEDDRPSTQPLALSHGATRYDTENDSSYKDVFARADRIMYDDKRAYYRTTGNRRRR